MKSQADIEIEILRENLTGIRESLIKSLCENSHDKARLHSSVALKHCCNLFAEDYGKLQNEIREYRKKTEE